MCTWVGFAASTLPKGIIHHVLTQIKCYTLHVYNYFSFVCYRRMTIARVLQIAAERAALLLPLILLLSLSKWALVTWTCVNWTSPYHCIQVQSQFPYLHLNWLRVEPLFFCFGQMCESGQFHRWESWRTWTSSSEWQKPKGLLQHDVGETGACSTFLHLPLSDWRSGVYGFL